MENQQQPPIPQVPQTPLGMQPPLPNATAVLVLGIISIPTCFCYFTFGLIGMVCAIISIVLATKANKLYQDNPGVYSQVSYNNMKAGRICAIIGLILNAICFLAMIGYLIFVGTLISGAFSSFPWGEIN